MCLPNYSNLLQFMFHFHLKEWDVRSWGLLAIMLIFHLAFGRLGKSPWEHEWEWGFRACGHLSGDREVRSGWAAQYSGSRPWAVLQGARDSASSSCSEDQLPREALRVVAAGVNSAGDLTMPSVPQVIKPLTGFNLLSFPIKGARFHVSPNHLDLGLGCYRLAPNIFIWEDDPQRGRRLRPHPFTSDSKILEPCLRGG